MWSSYVQHGKLLRLNKISKRFVSGKISKYKSLKLHVFPYLPNCITNKDVSFLNSLRTRLFLCVLDVLDVPKHKRHSSPNEKDFLTMLKYSEIWKRLLCVKGELLKNLINFSLSIFSYFFLYIA